MIITELEPHTACLICDILLVKKAAKSLLDLLDSSSGGIDAKEFYQSLYYRKEHAGIITVCAENL